VPLASGSSVPLDRVAGINMGALTRYGAVTEDGRGETAQAIVIALKGADANAVVAHAKARLAELQPSLPKGVRVVSFYDRSELIERATGSVTRALIEASLLVIVLLVLFLGNVRAAVVVSVTLPFAALSTFLLMH